MTTIDRVAEVTLTAAMRTGEEETTATVTLVGLGADYVGEARAPRSHRKLTAEAIDRELAIARALDEIHHQLMESIHERIDRSADDI